jgi:hypothetical protein
MSLMIYNLKNLAIFKIKLFKFIKYLFFWFLKTSSTENNEIINPAKISKNQCSHHAILAIFISITNKKNE